ncbi:MAG: DUF72 domain-containing protein [Pseudomonadota bacterium]|nr:DUF72 domain-containing protein [Pseudomonadota bacterium]
MSAGTIRVGVGGWTFEPWRGGTFYPKGLAHSRELHYASRRLTAIEINGTYYSTQKRESFAKWRDETPDDFVFSLKASRYATNRRVLAEAGESIERFIGSGLDELCHKLGPIVWQFAPTKRFDPEDFEAFLALLPTTLVGRPLRHAMDVRHESFKAPAYLALARRYGVATVFTDSDAYPSFADITGDFFYARLMRTRADIASGCEPAALDAIAACARLWAAGGEPDALPRVEPRLSLDEKAASMRDTFLYFISGAKERAPAAAQALIERLA